MNSFLEKFKKPKDPLHVSKIINPHRHWILIVHTFFVLSFILIVGSFYLLYKIENEQFVQVIDLPSSQKTLLKDGLLKSITENMQIKISHTQNLISKPVLFKDPSI